MSSENVNDTSIKKKSTFPNSNKAKGTKKDEAIGAASSIEHTSVSSIRDMFKEANGDLRQSKEDIQRLNDTAQSVSVHIQNLESELNMMRGELLECLSQPVSQEERQELIQHIGNLMQLLESLAEQKGTMKLMHTQIQERIESQQELEEHKAFLIQSKMLDDLEELEKWEKMGGLNNMGKDDVEYENVEDIIKKYEKYYEQEK